MNIAIVEDSCEDRECILKRLQQYLKDNHLTYEIFEYGTAEEFIEDLKKRNFTIVFMDIYLAEMTGMEAAIILRKMDKDCKIIFLTTSAEYVLQGYSVNASHYLLKPVEENRFLEAMANCRLRPDHEVPYLDLSYGGGPANLDTRRITHIILQGRTVYIHTTGQVFMINSSFSKVTALLSADRRFLQSIQGVMVNMDYISGHEESVFILKTGERIPINLRNRKRIQQIYRDYIFENMGGTL